MKWETWLLDHKIWKIDEYTIYVRDWNLIIAEQPKPWIYVHISNYILSFYVKLYLIG